MKSNLSKTRGQMFRKKIEPQLFIFSRNQHVGLHTWFVRKPLDIFYINANGLITSKVTLTPWKTCKGTGKYILETEVGHTTYKEGDLLQIEL